MNNSWTIHMGENSPVMIYSIAVHSSSTFVRSHGGSDPYICTSH